MQSNDRNRLIQKVLPIVVHGDNYAIRSGLDFWFAPEGEDVKVPVRWKQFLLTCSAIYPLVLFVPMALAPVTNRIGIERNGLLSVLAGTITICFLMTYIIMPRYTKLVRRWLYGSED
jgi:antibiotic biosynthesis monooxygenase (ABM) superfamily enzyme